MYGEYPTESRPDPNYWLNFLNDRAVELGLEKNVKLVKPPDGVVRAIEWVYQDSNDGQMIDLGYSVEAAETALRALAGEAGG